MVQTPRSTCDLTQHSPLTGVHRADVALRNAPHCAWQHPPLQLVIFWINMRGHTQRAAHAADTLARALSRVGSLGNNVVVQHSTRFEAIAPTCSKAGQPCKLNAPWSRWNASEVFAMEPSKLRQHTPRRKRGFAIGNWLSHLNCYQQCLDTAPLPDACLVMEDDAGLAPGVLQALPCVLRRLDDAVGRSWHALRLGCWGSRFADDCIRPPNLFFAQSHAFNSSAEALAPGGGMAYGGAHLTLVRPATTLAELVGRLLQMGVMAIDVGLTNPPRHQQAAHGRAGRQRRSGAEPLRSYVLDHPGAYIDHRLDGLESSRA